MHRVTVYKSEYKTIRKRPSFRLVVLYQIACFKCSLDRRLSQSFKPELADRMNRPQYFLLIGDTVLFRFLPNKLLFVF